MIMKQIIKPQECWVCKQIFLAPEDLISHFDYFHSNHHFSTSSSSAATATANAAHTTFRHYPNPVFPARNRFDLSYYRSGYLDGQGRFHKGLPPAPAAITPEKKSNSLFTQQKKKTKLMDLVLEASSEGIRTLPLICQLEQRRPEDTVTENGGAISSSLDLTLRL